VSETHRIFRHVVRGMPPSRRLTIADALLDFAHEADLAAKMQVNQPFAGDINDLAASFTRMAAIARHTEIP